MSKKVKTEKEYIVSIEARITAKSPQAAAECMYNELGDYRPGTWWFQVQDEAAGKTYTRGVKV